jgi:periplasmic mercuric ion binding protein
MARFAVLAAAVVVLLPGAPLVAAEKTVELKSVHMCCPGCAKAVGETLKKVEGVSGVTVDQKTATARFTAADDKAAQRALDALSEEGFHGDTGGSKDYAFKNDSGVKAGKVKSLTVTGFRNSCPGCVLSFREAIKDVPGVTGDTAKSKVRTCEVTGDFDAAALVKALNDAGFHVKVK